MHADPTLIGLALIFVFGVGAQWLAWRTRIPSILLLLLVGLAVGNYTDLIRPDELFGDLLFPAVSLAVAIILFEGGLSLRYSEVREVGRVVLLLVSAGATVTWFLAAVAAWAVLGLDPVLAVLTGAILTVTGPTVIMPLIRLVKPLRPVGPILKWEGIVIDPIGAMLTVLVFEAIATERFPEGARVFLIGPIRTLLAGGLVGVAAAAILIGLLRRYLVPDHLQNPVAVLFVVGAFALSNTLQGESGLFAAPLMGLILANRKEFSVRHIIEFQENIRVLLLAGLFIVLGARVSFGDLGTLTWRSGVFLALLVVLVRPAAVAISTFRSSLQVRERAYLALMAPRGVVAAAVASLYSIRLVDSGFQEAERLVPEIFLVIIGTVAIYGLGAVPLARALNVAKRSGRGILIIGAYAWAREMATALEAEGQQVVLVDTNPQNVGAARAAALRVYQVDALSEEALEHLEVEGIGRVLAMTSNNEFNALAALHFSERFERAELYQLPPERREGDGDATISHHLRGRLLFSPDLTFLQLTARFVSGARIHSIRVRADFTLDELSRRFGPASAPLFLITESNDVQIYTTDNRPTPKPGQTLICLVEVASLPSRPRPARSGPARSRRSRRR